MVITLLRSYPSLHKEGPDTGKRKLDKKGEPITVFVYKVTGKKEDLDRYKQIQTDDGIKTVEEGTTVLWFTVNPVGKRGTLRISTNGKVYADTTAIDLAQSMIKQHPGQLGLMLAKEILAEGFVTAEADTAVPIDNL